jgi:hypothetical protein
MHGENLKTISFTWPFAVWGFDIVGPSKRAGGGMIHVLVMVDKFFKWVDGKPIKNLDGSTKTTQGDNSLLVRYDYPHSSITDNGSHFAMGKFRKFCRRTCIRFVCERVGKLSNYLAIVPLELTI